MSVTGTSTLKERIAALQQRGTSPQPTSPPRSQTPTGSGGLRDKIARFEEKGGTPIPRGSFGLGAPPQQSGKRNNELWGNRIPSARRTPSGNNAGSLGRSATLSVNIPAKTRRSASTSEVQLGELQLSIRESIAHKKEGSKESDVINSLDIGICTPTSPTFSGGSYTRSLIQTPSLPEESTVVSRERDQSVSGLEAPREAPNSALNSPSPIADLSDELDAPKNVPEHLSNTIVPASEAVGNSGDARPVDAPLGVADINTQIPIIIEERSSPSSSPSHQIDTSQPEIPLPVEVTSAEMVPSQGDAFSELPDPSMPASDDASSEPECKLLVPCDAFTTSNPYTSLHTVDTTQMEPEDHGKPGKSPALEDDFTVLSETKDSFNQISQLTPSSISESQTQCPPPSPPPSPPPPLAYDSSIIPLENLEVWTDVASSSQSTTLHPNHPPQRTTPIVVSPLSSSTTPDAYSKLTVEPHNPTVADSGQCNLTISSQRPVSTSASLFEASSDSLLPVSPILDAFPAVPKSLPSTYAPVRAHTVHSHRTAADRSSTSSIKSTPSLSFSSTSSSSTCSPIATSTAPSQPPTHRPAAVVQSSKSKGRPISSVPAWYDDDSDDGEAGWANVVVTRRYY